MMDTACVSVVGSGLVHSIGGKQELLGLMAGQKVPFAAPEITSLTTLAPALKNLRRMPRYVKMALLAALLAIEEAQWRDTDLRQTALVLGSAYGGSQMTLDFMDSILENGSQLASPTAFSHSVNNMGAGLLSLALGLEGPCQTVSQFELSFAGALEVAMTLLAVGRVNRVLLGAVDEIDERFVGCCPQLRYKSGIPLTEGGVFFCLERMRPRTAGLRLKWGENIPNHSIVFLSGFENRLLGERHQQLYGNGPLSQALDTLWALQLLEDHQASAVDCYCTAADSGAKACIEVRSIQ